MTTYVELEGNSTSLFHGVKGKADRCTLEIIPKEKTLAMDGFRAKFPWAALRLRSGNGLTKRCGSAAISGMLLPTFCAMVVNFEVGIAMPPYRGELWLKPPTVMKSYLGTGVATAATVDPRSSSL
ncbi:hypothetical protein L1987_34965 [Smallanthus sonchifolius]|uniref:Uncharacterized protein n=1 Tax=Smallanthus sonchifolius TaxID=185202 RepID=A0ACB9HWI6_9ASTR|nr:hypothetical protein L1987_34965 [Smallanthus sonchifolius]